VTQISTQEAARAGASFPKAELPPGGSRVVTLGRREVVVFNVDGKLYAVFNRCPHQQARMSGGSIGGTTIRTGSGRDFEYGMEGQILRCPWHHYEFDLENGRCMADPGRFRIATYVVSEEGDEIRVYA
jgi:3-phenylpropionate/trans-cinnamate dioxygenase ferredoxin subunit